MFIIMFILACILSAIVGYIYARNLKNKVVISAEQQIDKYRLYYEVCNKWLKVEFDKYNIEDFFAERGYKTIAIYGMGELGNRLIEKLTGSSINIKYGIDQNPTIAYAEIDILSFDEVKKFEEIDCIVVSSIHVYENIKKKLEDKCECEIISLEDIVYGV